MDRNRESHGVVNRIVRRYRPEKVILFDSAARGDGRSDSDIDPLIIKQCSEKRPCRSKKVFEALLVLHGIEPPRIHDLPKLLDSCVRIAPELKGLQDACELLTGLYVEARYPPEIPDYSKEDLVRAFEEARLVRALIEEVVAKD